MPLGRSKGYHRGPFHGPGRRMTGPRRMILSVLENAEDYMSAEEVYMTVYANYPGIGIATVYRTLQILAEMGMAERIDTGEGKARYRLAPREDRRRQIVLVCTGCSRTIPVAPGSDGIGSRIADLENVVGNAHGFTVQRTMVQLFGLCDRCRSV